MHASQLAALQRCPELVSTILKRGGSLLLASKILVLSRHLHKKSLAHSGASVFIEKIRLRLGRLRQTLLSTIDRRMGSLEVESSSLVDAMGALSLATSSSCADILRHFHHIRSNAISSEFQQETVQSADAIQRLQIWIRTMQDTQHLFPRQVSSALAKLKSIPLLKDESLRGVQDFDLDIHEAWMDDDIKNFTPYVLHDDLNVSTAAQRLSSWAPAALQSYIEGLKTMLSSIESFEEILNLRRDCLRLWVSSKGRLVGTTKSEALDLLRSAFQERLQEILKAHSRSIDKVVSAVAETIESSSIAPTEMTVPSLWSDSLTKADISNGARSLTDMLRTCLYGRSKGVTQVMKVYEQWLAGTNNMNNAIGTLKSLKWDIEDIDDGEDDLDEVEDMRFRLEKEDPADLANTQKNCVHDSMRDLIASVANQKDTLSRDRGSVEKAAFLLRVTREVKQQLPEGLNLDSVDFSFVQQLHHVIAVSIAERIFSIHRRAMVKASTQLSIPGRLLWDGEPELPIVPSPWPYRLLDAIQKAMSEFGADIWTKRAVDGLKTHSRQLISRELTRVDEGQPSSRKGGHQSEPLDNSSTVNGEAHTEEENHRPPMEEDGAPRDTRIQLLFDVEYLTAALLPCEIGPEDTLNAYSAGLLHELELPDNLAARIEVASKDYWRRTGLIFGLLVQS